MTRVHHRHLRVIWEPRRKEKPWVVQSCITTSPGHAWTDILRFSQPQRAAAYVEEISARDRALYEANR